ncbi:MAG: PaaI family thioesterase [Polyangiales bacterium]
MPDDPPRPFDRARALPLVEAAFRDMVPFNAALGLQVVDIAPGVVVLRLPWREELVGNPRTGVLHGGAITALLDACGGASVFLKMQKPIPIATLDLRIDYLKPAAAGRDVFARSECYKLGRSVAFVRAVAYTEPAAGEAPGRDEDDWVATAAATFMLATKGDSVMGRAARGGK